MSQLSIFEHFLSVGNGNLKPKLKWFFKPKFFLLNRLPVSPVRRLPRGSARRTRATRPLGASAVVSDAVDVWPRGEPIVSPLWTPSPFPILSVASPALLGLKVEFNFVLSRLRFSDSLTTKGVAHLPFVSDKIGLNSELLKSSPLPPPAPTSPPLWRASF